MVTPVFEMGVFIFYYDYLTKLPKVVDSEALCRDDLAELPQSDDTKFTPWLASKNLVCDSSYELISDHIALLLLLAFVVGTLLLAPLADRFGRKIMNVAYGVTQLLTFSYFTLAFRVEKLQDLKVLTGLILITAAVTSGRFLNTLIYLSELTVTKFYQWVIGGAFLGLALRVIITALLKINTDVQMETAAFFMVSIGINVLTLGLQTYFIPESPYFLFFSHRCDDFYDCLARIKRFNNRSDPQLATEELWKLHPEARK